MSNGYSSRPWWHRDVKDPHTKLSPLIDELQLQQGARYRNMRKMTAAYEYGGSATSARSADLADLSDEKLRMPVAKNAIDTLHAQVCTPRITVEITTEGGNFEQRERAQQATQAIRGLFAEENIEELKEDIVLDAMLNYCGFVRVDYDVDEEGSEGDDEDAEEREESGMETRMRLKRVQPEDMLVDESEGRDRFPRCMFQRHYEDRFKAIATYGRTSKAYAGTAKDRKESLRKAQPAQPTQEENSDNKNQIELWEAWHLPSTNVTDPTSTKHDGRYVLFVKGGITLIDMKWSLNVFPHFVYRPEKARKGFWGLATMRHVMPAQREHDRTTAKLQRAMTKAAMAGLIVDENAKVNTKEFTDGVGKIITVKGSPQGSVMEWNPAPANPQHFQYREQVATDALRYIGVSPFAAQSEVPAGLDRGSGVALTKFEDQENKRVIIKHRTLERWMTDGSLVVFEVARWLVKTGHRICTRYDDGERGLQAIDWADIVDVLEDRRAYKVRVQPASWLAETPAAKVQQLDSMLDRQALSTDDYISEVGSPDMKALVRLKMADTLLVHKQLTKMLTSGVYTPPYPFANLEAAIEIGRKFLNLCILDEVKDAKFQLVTRYVDDLKAELAKSTPAMPAPMGPPMGGPMPGDPMGGGMPMDPMAGAPPMGGPPGAGPMIPGGMPPFS